MKKRKIKARKGMTLIEVVMSVALIAILLIPLANVAMTTLKTNKKSEIKQEASQVGQDVMEELKSYDELKVVSGNKVNFSKGELTYNPTDDKNILKGTFSGIKQDNSSYNAKVTFEKDASLNADQSGTGLSNYIQSKSGMVINGIINIRSYDSSNKKYTIVNQKYNETKKEVEDKSTNKISKYDKDKSFVLKVNNNAYYFYEENSSISNDDDSVPKEYIQGVISNTSASEQTIIIVLSKELKEKTIPTIKIHVENNLSDNKMVNLVIWKEAGTQANEEVTYNEDKSNFSQSELTETTDVNLGDLYKITVEVTKKGDDSDVIFKTISTKNLKFKN